MSSEQERSPESDAPCRKGDRSQARHVRARKDHRCEWCGKPIPKGSDHVVATEFPGGDAGYADAAGHPVRMRIHGEPPCHYHGETRPLPPGSGDTP